MARPEKIGADYYPHSAHLRNDPVIKTVRLQFGDRGELIFRYLLETLTQQRDFKLKWSDKDSRLLALDYGVQPEEISSVVDLLIYWEKLVLEEGLLYCPEHLEGLEPLLDNRKRTKERQRERREQRKAKQEAQKKKSKESPVTTGVVLQTTQDVLQTNRVNATVKESKVKESKVKESKVKESKEERESKSAPAPEKIEEAILVEDQAGPQGGCAKNEEDPVSLVFNKLKVRAGEETRDVWKMKYGINGELEGEMLKFSKWYVGKQDTMTESELGLHMKRVAPSALMASFEVSFLKNWQKHQDKNGHGKSKDTRSRSERAHDRYKHWLNGVPADSTGSFG